MDWLSPAGFSQLLIWSPYRAAHCGFPTEYYAKEISRRALTPPRSSARLSRSANTRTAIYATRFVCLRH